MHIIKAVPTNIITGALGAGKTTFVKALLKSKPSNERWAVLVNEFGEIGIDGALLKATISKKIEPKQGMQTVFLREVPGGCMCCASGLPMQIALNQLLAIAKPHRLLIEPTGLGHPKELIQVLTSKYYKEVIKLDATLCLIDARKLNDKKWRNHKTFQDQVEIADLIVSTKCDLYTNKDKRQLKHYLANTCALNTPVTNAVKGELSTDILSIISKPSNTVIKAVSRPTKLFESQTHEKSQKPKSRQQSEYLKKTKNSGDGFYSQGWIWPSSYWFDYAEVIDLFNTLNVTRVKGLLITNKGIFGLNGQAGELDISEYDEAFESRLEIIADSELAARNAANGIEKLLAIVTCLLR